MIFGLEVDTQYQTGYLDPGLFWTRANLDAGPGAQDPGPRTRDLGTGNREPGTGTREPLLGGINIYVVAYRADSRTYRLLTGPTSRTGPTPWTGPTREQNPKSEELLEIELFVLYGIWEAPEVCKILPRGEQFADTCHFQEWRELLSSIDN